MVSGGRFGSKGDPQRISVQPSARVVSRNSLAPLHIQSFCSSDWGTSIALGGGRGGGGAIA